MEKNENGNALFLILIAVALFAALSYAVTQSGRGGAGIDKEQAQIFAAQIVQIGSQIEQAVTRLRLINGCSETEISFHYDSDDDGTLEADGSDDYYNPNAPADFSCNVFHVNGGGLSYKQPNSRWLDGASSAETSYEELFFTGRVCVPDIGTGDTTCTSNPDDDSQEELIFFLPFLNEDLCFVLAKQFGILNNSGDIPIDFGAPFNQNSPFEGIYEDGWGIENAGGADTDRTIAGHPVGCIEAGGTTFPGSYHYYHVLLAR